MVQITKEEKPVVDNAIVCIRKAKFEAISGEEVLAVHAVLSWLHGISERLSEELKAVEAPAAQAEVKDA